jgi:TfoX/Sxy family transcriptional regulator of competence genes
MAFDEKTAERVRVMLSGRRDIAEKKMMGGLCFMMKGGMCCSVSGRGGLLVRINPENQEQLLREPHVQPMEMGARTMKGFVRVAPEAYRTEALLRKWIMRGVEAVETRAAKGKKHKRMPTARAKS